MTLARVLLVDDSEAVLAYEHAALGGLHAISTARNGVEALEQMRALKPDIVLLDLSMPVLDGDEVVRRAQADPALRDIPIVVVSSEIARAEACLSAGADAFLPKPVRTDELRAIVARVLDRARERRTRRALAILPLRVGPIDLALSLEDVRSVAMMPATRPLPGAPFYLGRCVDVRGTPIAVLDLGLRLGVTRRAAMQDRKLVVVRSARPELGLPLAVDVDDVIDPEELLAHDVQLPNACTISACPALASAVTAIAHTRRATLPVIAPELLVPAQRLVRLRELLERSSPPIEGACR